MPFKKISIPGYPGIFSEIKRVMKKLMEMRADQTGYLPSQKKINK